MDREKQVTVRVGAFVFVGIVVFTAVVLLLGSERGIFSRGVDYHASFDAVDGLKAGAPVRLAGVEIGQVTGIAFYPELADKRVRITVNVDARFEDRIRSDSVASVGSRGVLGDKVIDVSIGNPEAPPLEPGGELGAATATDYTEILKKGAQVIDNTVAITDDLRQLIAAYNTPEFKENVTGVLSTTGEVLEEIKSGNGALHALIYDEATGGQLRELIAATSAAARRADDALARLDAMLVTVERGEGLVGALINDPAGKNTVQDLAIATHEIGQIAAAIRTEKSGLLHSVIYGGEGELGTMSGDLALAAKDLRMITTKIREGNGSLGALINDPTLYEDLKTILGNVKRNRILRELVRYSISQRDEVEGVGKPE